MIDFLVSILEANINFQTVGAILILYFASIWFLFCLWVFIDARKRFEKTPLALFFFFVVLIFNFPGLIFYLIIRPEKNEDHFLYLQNNEPVSESSGQGIDVPIINFVGENGEINLSFQLKVNKMNIPVNLQSSSDISGPDLVQVNVDVPDTPSETVKIQPANMIQTAKSEEVKIVQDTPKLENKKIKVSLSSIGAKVSSNIRNIKASFSKKSNQPDTIEVSLDNTKDEKTTPAEIITTSTGSNEAGNSSKNKKDKNRKKRRRR